MEDETKYYLTEKFLWIAFYNGYMKEVNDIYVELKNPNERGKVERPEIWRVKPDYGVDEFCGIFWSWLVLVFGEYGASPRFGWIEKENVELLLQTFEKFKVHGVETDNDTDFTDERNW